MGPPKRQICSRIAPNYICLCADQIRACTIRFGYAVSNCVERPSISRHCGDNICTSWISSSTRSAAGLDFVALTRAKLPITCKCVIKILETASSRETKLWLGVIFLGKVARNICVTLLGSFSPKTVTCPNFIIALVGLQMLV